MTAPSCIVTGKGVSCEVKGATSMDPGLKIRLKNLPKSPVSYKFAIKFNKRSEPAPFDEPVIVTLSEVSRGVRSDRADPGLWGPADGPSLPRALIGIRWGRFVRLHLPFTVFS